MSNTTGQHNVAAYFQQALAEDGRPRSTFAKAWGTNSKTLDKLLAGEEPRSDALDRIREARGWPVDAFIRLRRGQPPTPEIPDDIADRVVGIEKRLEQIESHLGINAPGGRHLRAAQGGGKAPGPAKRAPRRKRPSPPVEE